MNRVGPKRTLGWALGAGSGLAVMLLLFGGVGLVGWALHWSGRAIWNRPS